MKAEKSKNILNFPVLYSNTKPARLFALYAATTTFPAAHVENEYLKVCYLYFLKTRMNDDPEDSFRPE